MRTPSLVLSAGLVTLLSACASSPRPAGTSPAMPGMATASTVQRANVALASASGSLVSGTLAAMPMGSGVHFMGEIGGLKPGGSHAIHVHAKGDCSAADASSAGDHFNPAMRAHGKVGGGMHHGGDMDNIVADSRGVAKVNVHADGIVLGGGMANDALGKAVVVHAMADDYTTQPSGNAGGRIACGVIR